MNIPNSIWTLLAGIAITLLSLWYGQNHGLMPIAASQTAKEVDDIFNFMMTIATGLFLLVEGLLVVSIIKFRRKKGDTTDGPPVEGNIPLEILWTSIPTVIVFIIAVYSFEIYNRMGGLDPMAGMDHGTKVAHHDHSQMIALDPDQRVALGLGAPMGEDSTPAVNVNVQGMQYAWIFTYPETGIVSGELYAPVDQEVRLNIDATDVLHAFWVPELRLKQDAIPGRSAELRFTANRIGDYPIICAELCGSYHGGMKTTLHVVSTDDYQNWINSQQLAEVPELPTREKRISDSLQVTPDILAQIQPS